jgi:probable HAF family extracellular repeat protein
MIAAFVTGHLCLQRRRARRDRPTKGDVMTVRHLRKAIVRGTLTIALSLLALWATHVATVPVLTRGQTPSYLVIDLPSLTPGTVSEGRHVNNEGVVSGLSHESRGARRATAWIDGQPHDLGTLGGPHSAVIFTDFTGGGPIVGIAETGLVDPRNEAFS